MLNSARPLLGRLRSILWELTPSKWAAANVSLAAGLEVLQALFPKGGSRFHSFFSSRPAFCDHHRGLDVCRRVISPVPLVGGLLKGAVYIPDVPSLAMRMARSNWTAAENIFSVAAAWAEAMKKR